MTFPLQSSTPAKYIFKLISSTETIICSPEPLEWAAGSTQIKRDLESGGVVTSFVVDSLTFVGNSAVFLSNLYVQSELSAKCTLKIYRWKSTTREYIQFPTSYDINFNFYEVVKVGRFAFGVRVKAINSSTQTKLDNRSGVDINICGNTSIGGVSLPALDNISKVLNYGATNITYNANLWKDIPGVIGWDLPRVSSGDGYTSVPLDIRSSEFSEVQNVVYVTKVNPLKLVNVPSFFNHSLFDRTLDLHYKITIKVINQHSGTEPWSIEILETRDEGDIVKNAIIINTYVLQTIGNSKGIWTIDNILTVSLTKGNSLKWVVKTGCIQDIKAELWENEITITESAANSSAVSTEGLPVYEAIERTCQHILDVTFPIYSEFFGRNENIYNEIGSHYTNEDQLRFAHVQTGLNQQGAKIGNELYPVTIQFKTMMKSLRALWNIGWGLETIGGAEKVRIEDYLYFFQDSEIIDFSEQLTQYDIESQVMPELVPLSVSCGFDSFEYLSINGRGEPNTTNKRTTTTGTDTKVEIISDWRGDTKGIFDNLENPIDVTQTTDTKSESDIFIVKTQRSGSNWKPETNENISVDNQSSLFKDELLNRYFTPSRILIRHGNRLSAGFMKMGAAEVLRYQTSEKANNLQSTETGKDQIIENSDILLTRLGNPIFKAIKHTFTVEFTWADWETILNNPYGYIRASVNVYGYLLSLKKRNNENKAEITIIQKY